MIQLPIFDRQGKTVGSIDVDPAEFAPHINKQLLHDVVVMYQSNRRQGSAKSKTRGEVAGSTKKMYRQKGTGNARAGSRRSGIRRGGGHIHAKHPRDYSYRLPRKAVQLATRMAIASKLLDNQVVVVDELAFDRPATKVMAGILGALGLGHRKTLVATQDYDVNVFKSGRNIAGVSVLPVSDLNALEVLLPEKLVLTQAGLESLRAKVKSESPAEAMAG